MSKKPTYEELEKRVQELEKETALYRKRVKHQRFIEIHHALIEFATTHNLDMFLRQALDVVSQFVDSSIGFYHFVEPDQKTLSLQQWSTMTGKEFCKAEGANSHYSIDKAGVWVDCIYAGAPVIHNDYESLKHKKGMPEGHAKVIRELVVPVLRKNKVVAVLGVGNKPVDYTDKDAEIVSYFADVTWEIVRQKRAEKALIDEKLRSEEYINSLPGLFYVFDEFNLVTWNREFRQVTGFSDKELSGRIAMDFFEDSDKPLIKMTMQKAYQEGIAETEATLVTKEGERIPYYVTGVRKVLDGKDHIIGLGIDITERVRVEKEKQQLQEHLQQSYKMEAIGALAGGIAHKFNNYLSGISGNIELLKMVNSDVSGMDKYTERMSASIFKMANLANQLLAYAEGGKYVPKNLSIGDFLDDTLSIITRRMPSSIKVETDIPEDTLNIEGDPIQIQMVLSAVIENATEAIGTDGLVRIVARKETWDDTTREKTLYRRPGKFISVKVIDNGKGMDEETQRRVFEPFFTTHFQGRGLGMAAVYGIVKNHNGWIDIESEPGKGTVVSICFPAVETRAEKPESLPARYYHGTGTILLIEDEEMFIDVGNVMLQNMGYRVLVAKCGKDAIHMARTFKGDIDVALLDMGLPDMDGEKLYSTLMETRPDMRVIVCSGYSIDGPVRKVLDAGAQDFLQKPFTFAELSLKIRQITDRRKYKRYKIRKNALAILKSSPSRKGHIVDIGKGGLSYVFSEDKARSAASIDRDVLTIDVNENGVSLDNIPCNIITDVKIDDDSVDGNRIIIRRSIRFGDMTPEQKKQLADFIKSQAEEE